LLVSLRKTPIFGADAPASLGEDLETGVAVAMRILSRFFAVLLVVLTVSPVTAPFAACDLTALASEEGHATADSKILKETTTVAAFVDASIRLDDGTVVFVSSSARVARPCQAAPAILRL
jgi:hypothetical protein